ncbi:Eukaryotic DNA primase small subunit [Mollivirus sibericum]|uniref:Eukaryotic DNA primase small subunit n=1 Tax=Mollivirus sibericum TaxID=1678078 RepID=UPI0006B2EBCA|nr:Eukaryotic DNA primase small subunit [Mollivirus sibericum]ALD62234.1 Eukaryotic DNA primase small subunit [Mollivirus sibericum]
MSIKQASVSIQGHRDLHNPHKHDHSAKEEKKPEPDYAEREKDTLKEDAKVTTFPSLPLPATTQRRLRRLSPPEFVKSASRVRSSGPRTTRTDETAQSDENKRMSAKSRRAVAMDLMTGPSDSRRRRTRQCVNAIGASNAAGSKRGRGGMAVDVHRYRSHMWRFCRDNRLIMGKDDERQYDILMLDGGTVHLPYNLYDGFLLACAQDIAQNLPIFVSEQRSPIFRFHVDFDVVWYPEDGERPYSKQQVVQLVRYLQGCIRLFFEPNEATPEDELPSKEELDLILTTVVLEAPLRDAVTGEIIRDLDKHLAQASFSSSSAVGVGGRGTATAASSCHESDCDCDARLEEEGDDESNDGFAETFGHAAAATSTTTRSPLSNGIKQGFHFEWPRFAVCHDMSLTMREVFLSRFEREFGKRTGRGAAKNPISKIFDANIYLSNGLRMPWSFKMKPCFACAERQKNDAKAREANNNRRRPLLPESPCDACGGSGEQIDEACYRPTMVIHGATGERVKPDRQLMQTVRAVDLADPHWPLVATALVARVEEVFLSGNRPSTSDIYQVLSICGIRLRDDEMPTLGWSIFKGCPRYKLKELDEGLARRTQEAVVYCMREKRMTEQEARDYLALQGLRIPKECLPNKGAGARKKRYIPPTDHLFALMEGLIRSKFGKVFAFVEGREMTVTSGLKSGDSYKMTLKGQGAHYCFNVGKDHTNAEVYFVLDSWGIRQGCTCNCPVEVHNPNSGSTCRAWSNSAKNSTKTRLQLDVLAVFFPSLSMRMGLPAIAGPTLLPMHDITDMMATGKNSTHDSGSRGKKRAREASLVIGEPSRVTSISAATAASVGMPVQEIKRKRVEHIDLIDSPSTKAHGATAPSGRSNSAPRKLVHTSSSIEMDLAALRSTLMGDALATPHQPSSRFKT